MQHFRRVHPFMTQQTERHHRDQISNRRFHATNISEQQQLHRNSLDLTAKVAKASSLSCKKYIPRAFATPFVVSSLVTRRCQQAWSDVRGNGPGARGGLTLDCARERRGHLRVATLTTRRLALRATVKNLQSSVTGRKHTKKNRTKQRNGRERTNG